MPLPARFEVLDFGRLSPAYERHLRRHHGHELNVGIEREARHIYDCACHVLDFHSWLDLDIPVRLQDALGHTLRHFGGSVADVDLAASNVVLAAIQGS